MAEIFELTGVVSDSAITLNGTTGAQQITATGTVAQRGPVDTTYTDTQLALLFSSTDFTVTVGTSGNYATVNDAITALSRKKSLYKKDGFRAAIQIQSGFTMAEQVFARSIDLSWITITSVDAEVPVDASAITTLLQPLGLVNSDNLTPIFGGTDNAALPIIGVLFAFPDQGDGYAASPKDGVAVIHNSSVLFRPGAGVKRPRNGLKVLYGSAATCYMPGLTQGGAGGGGGTVTGVDFSYATGRAVHVGFGSKANLARSILHHSKGDYGIYVIWASHGDFYQSQVHDTINGYAITCRDGSFANMRETNVARSVRGYHALHNARINARNHANVWSGDSAKDCTGYGILASYGSHVDASEVDVSGSAIGVNASNVSSVSMQNGIALSCTTRAIGAFQGSSIDAWAVPVDNSGEGFKAQYGSTINALDTTATNCTIGYNATDASVINANNAVADNCGIGFQSWAGSTLNADSSHANSCTNHGYYAIEKSDIQARNSAANSATNHGFHSERASTINARGSSAMNCAIAFDAFEGGNINAQSTTITGSTIGYFVDRDGRINAGASIGTATTKTNIPVNYRSGKGYISDSAAPTFGLTIDETTGRATFVAGAAGISKSDVGLSNVDNTSDASKPVSTAQLAAINAKVADAINDGTTTIAPSQNAVFDALALKAGVNDGLKVLSNGTGWSHTGDTLEHVLVTLTIPAGALGPNGYIELTTNWSCTNNANSKTNMVRFGGVAGTLYLNSPLTSNARLHTMTCIYNRNSQTSQIAGTNAGNQPTYGQSTTSQVTSAVDTTAAVDIVISTQLANAADTSKLESYVLKYHYQA